MLVESFTKNLVALPTEALRVKKLFATFQSAVVDFLLNRKDVENIITVIECKDCNIWYKTLTISQDRL